MLHATSASSMINSSCSVHDARGQVDARLSIASGFFQKYQKSSALLYTKLGIVHVYVYILSKMVDGTIY